MKIDTEARCSFTNAIVCKFEKTLETEDVLIERCAFCHKRISFNKINGQIDNKRYNRCHMRDMLQPDGPTGKMFDRIYGRDIVEKTNRFNADRNKKKDSLKDVRGEVKDIFDTYKRKTFL